MSDAFLPACIECGYDCQRLLPEIAACPECGRPRVRTTSLARGLVPVLALFIAGVVATGVGWGIASARVPNQHRTDVLFQESPWVYGVPAMLTLAGAWVLIGRTPPAGRRHAERAGLAVLGLAALVSVARPWWHEPMVVRVGQAVVDLFMVLLMVAIAAQCRRSRSLLGHGPGPIWPLLIVAGVAALSAVAEREYGTLFGPPAASRAPFATPATLSFSPFPVRTFLELVQTGGFAGVCVWMLAECAACIAAARSQPA